MLYDGSLQMQESAKLYLEDIKRKKEDQFIFCISLFCILFFVICFLFSCTKVQPPIIEEERLPERMLSPKVDPTFTNITILFMGIENRIDLARGWNDITMIITENSNSIDIISFPRDTFVYIPPKGYWTMNSLYLCLDGRGVKNYVSHTFSGIKIDYFIAYNMKTMHKIAEALQRMPIPKEFRDLAVRYDYVDSWIRERKKLRLEFERQARIQSFVKYIFEIGGNIPIPNIIQESIAAVFLEFAEQTDFTSIQEMTFLWDRMKKKPINLFMWPGEYKKVYFQLSFTHNGMIFQEGEKHVYALDHLSREKLIPWQNPFCFSTNEFVKLAGPPPILRISDILWKKVTNWNGGYTVNKVKIISDYEYTNQKWTEAQVFQFLHFFPKNKLSKEQIYSLIQHSRKNTLSIWMVLAQLQKESSLVGNESAYSYSHRERRAFGYNCATIGTNSEGHPIGADDGFLIQTKKGLFTMRKWFNAFQDPIYRGKPMYVYSYEKSITPENAATFALYKYTPFYGEAYPYGKITVGNRRFATIWAQHLQVRKSLGIK